MDALSRQNLKQVYRELDEVGVAISVVGTKRQKLMELARLVIPVSDALVGSRPEIRRIRDDLVRLTYNMRRVQTKQRPASRAVRAVALKIRDVQKIVDAGLGSVPREFKVGEMTLLNLWGYTPKEIKPFIAALERVNSILEKMGLSEDIGEINIVLDPNMSLQASMIYDLFCDCFFADPLRARARTRGISDAVGGRLWLKLFKQRDIDTWGGAQQSWNSFSNNFFLLVKGKSLKGRDAAKMAVSLGRIIGPDNWRKVA